MKTLIIIPVYNEVKNIERLIKEIQEDIDFADFIVIDDNSTDDTVKTLDKLNVNYISLPFNLGYAGALQCGFKYAVEYNYDYIIQLDGDGQHIPSETKKLFDTLIETRADIVIGSRFKQKTTYKHPFFRKLGTKIFEIVIKLFCNKYITDPTSGFQILNRRVFERYSKMYNFPQYPDANLIIEMILNNYKIEEIQVKMRAREYGTGMHNGLLQPFKYMIKTIYNIILILLNYISIKLYDNIYQKKV